MSTKNAPDFVIVGAAKSGTTAVHEYLGEHPSVFISTPKETDFFFNRAIGDAPRFRWGNAPREASVTITTDAQYRALFAGAAAGQLRGEASPSYMLDPRVPQLLHDWNPALRVILLLRDPAERAWSDFLHNQLFGTEPLPRDRFLEAFADGPRRQAEHWHLDSNYMIKGNYASSLAGFLAVFPRTQVGVFFYDDLRRDAKAFMRDIYTFIGVDPSFEPDVAQRYNVSGVPGNGWLHRFLYRPNLLKRALRGLIPEALRRRLRFRLRHRALEKAPPLPPEIRAVLAQHYLPEIERLELLCQRDLSAWKPRGSA